MTRLTRRDLLCGLSLPAGIVVASTATRELRPSTSRTRSRFDPAVNGFGFDNYSTPFAAADPSDIVSESDIREYLAAHWDAVLGDQLSAAPNGPPEPLVRALAAQLYANATQLFGTKGYCYGIASAAQWYFEAPAAVPLDRESVSEIEHVNEPLQDRSRTPVRGDIEQFHQIQFLDADSWVKRRPLLDPEWIDYRSQERELRAAIDRYGSAGVTITGKNVLRGHYVLLYDYEVTDTDVVFTAYDPNAAADEYAADEVNVIGIDTTSYEPVMGSYEDEYDRFLFNPADRRVRERVRSAADRDS